MTLYAPVLDLVFDLALVFDLNLVFDLDLVCTSP